ncbi:MAG: tetratricopeptide repeat protein [Anaerolineales bacterium]|nr:tetratricopeptide repeat protein [Anaerolineales bacterium]
MNKRIKTVSKPPFFGSIRLKKAYQNMRKSPLRVDTPPNLTLSLFGYPQLKDKNELLHLNRHKSMALLAYLLVNQGEHLRLALAALLWPDTEQALALALLRNVLSDLRRVCGSTLITEGPMVRLALEGIACDVMRFRKLIAEASTPTHSNHVPAPGSPCSTCQALLIEAVALVQEEFMVGFMLGDSASFQEWQTQQGQQLRQAYHAALEKLTEMYHQQMDYPNVQRYAARWAAADPLQERAHRYLMQAFALDGRRDLALSQYQKCKAELKQELGLPPQQETTALYMAIFSGTFRVGEATHDISDASRVREDGNATQKFPLTGFSKPPTNFPVPPTSFCGRTEEVTYLLARIQQPDCRLVTLLGMGGSGKTRLALELARTLAQDLHTLKAVFPAGLYFITLEALTHREHLLNKIAEALGFTLQPHESLEGQTIKWLRGKRLLLILDNFEPLIAEAPLLTELLLGLPELKILVTSRERLALQEEECLELSGLDYPPSAQPGEGNQALEAYEAVQLFLQRAGRAQSKFSLNKTSTPWVIQICQMLEGFPLGLELATEKLRTVSVQEIAESLAYHRGNLQTSIRNLPPRHASLQAVFDYSWVRLTEQEQGAYARLSIFPSGFTSSAAAVVLGVSQEMLFTLQDKSLVEKRQEGRYALHPVLKQLAAEKQAADPDSFRVTACSFTTYYLNLLARKRTSLQTNEQGGALEEVAAESENIRSAWTFALARGWLDMIEEALDSYYWYYLFHSLYHEGALVFQLATQMLVGEHSLQVGRLRGKMLNRQGRFLVTLGRLPEAQACFEESLRRASEADERREIAFSQNNLGLLASVRGQAAEAQIHFQAGLQGYQALEDQYEIGRVLSNLGVCAKTLGDYVSAYQYYLQSLEICQALGDIRGQAIRLSNLGNLALAQGDYLAAQKHQQAAYEAYRQINDVGGLASSLTNLGNLALEQKACSEAEGYYRESLALARACENQSLVLATRLGLGKVFALQRAEEAASEQFWEALQLATELQAAVSQQNALLQFAELFSHAQGKAQAKILALEIATGLLAQPNLRPQVKAEAQKIQDQLTAQGSPAELIDMQAREVPLTVEALIEQIEGYLKINDDNVAPTVTF